MCCMHMSVVHTLASTHARLRAVPKAARAPPSRARLSRVGGAEGTRHRRVVCVCARRTPPPRRDCSAANAWQRTPRPHRGRRSGVIPPGRRAPADRRARWSAVPCPRRRCGHPAHPAAPGTRHAARAGPARLPLARHRKSQSSNQPVTMMRGTRDHFVVLAGAGWEKRMSTGTTTKWV